MSIVPLAEAHDPARFGGKAATLATLASAHRVPPGFGVAADASDDDVRALVPEAYARLGAAVAVAVRSSAIGEDSRDASFAGQHETILNVRGAGDVVEAVLAVRRSATSERAVAYRREKGIAEIPRVGVLVQRMVEATASAIAFTVDPVSGDRDRVVVNACRGLGDAMASGDVTPDEYRVRRDDLAVVARDAPAATLTDDQVRAVARLALELDRRQGHPVDVEAALEGDTLYLLQSRPITAAGARDDDFPIAWPEPGDERLSWTREDAHFNFVLRPLSVEWVQHGPSMGIELRNRRIGIPVRMRFAEFNGVIYTAVGIEGAPEERQRIQRDALEKRRGLGRRLADDWPRRYLPAVQAHFAWMAALDPAALPGDAAAAAWTELWRRHNEVWEIHMLVTGGAYSAMEHLLALYEELTGRLPMEAAALTQGRAGTLQQLQRDMHALTESVRALPEVSAAIVAGTDAPDVLADLPGGDAFTAAFAAFLERHGVAGQANEDFITPSWSADPPSLVREIRRALEAPPQDPDARLARLLAEGEATLERARAILRDRPDDLARFEEIVALARAVGPLTEEHNYWIDRFDQHHMRRAALAFGARLVADGSADDAERIFDLYVPEVADALRAPRDLRPLLAERERRHIRNVRRRIPKAIGAPSSGSASILPPRVRALMDLGFTVEQDDPSALKGVPACAGVVRGPARLVRGPSDFGKVRAGDVLVCRASNVSWVPLFGKVAAVVTEVGGALSHAAVVAREFGVPCVVAVDGALGALRDGEIVDVDGGAGTVRRSVATVGR